MVAVAKMGKGAVVMVVVKDATSRELHPLEERNQSSEVIRISISHTDENLMALLVVVEHIRSEQGEML